MPDPLGVLERAGTLLDRGPDEREGGWILREAGYAGARIGPLTVVMDGARLELRINDTVVDVYDTRGWHLTGDVGFFVENFVFELFLFFEGDVEHFHFLVEFFPIFFLLLFLL